MATPTSRSVSRRRYLNWTETHMDLWGPVIGPEATYLYLHLHIAATFPAGFGGAGHVNRSVRQLCADLRWTPRQVQRATRRLYEVGLIEVFRAHRGRDAAFVYQILPFPIYGESLDTPLQPDFRAWPSQRTAFPVWAGSRGSESTTRAGSSRVRNLNTDHKQSKDLDLKIKDHEIKDSKPAQNHDLGYALTTLESHPSKTIKPAIKRDETRARAAHLLATQEAALHDFATWCQSDVESVAMVFAPHPDLDWRYAPAALAQLRKRHATPRRLRNPAGAMVTWLRNEPRWRPQDFVTDPTGRMVALAPDVVCQIREAAPDKYPTAEALARAVRADMGSAAPALAEVLAAVAALRPELPHAIPGSAVRDPAPTTIGALLASQFSTPEVASVTPPAPIADAAVSTPEAPPEPIRNTASRTTVVEELQSYDFQDDVKLMAAKGLLRSLLAAGDETTFAEGLAVVTGAVVALAHNPEHPQDTIAASRRRLATLGWKAEWLDAAPAFAQSRTA